MTKEKVIKEIEIKSLPALLFYNLTEILNRHKIDNEFIYLNIQYKLRNRILELINYMLEESKPIDESKDTLVFFSDTLSRMKATGNVFKLIENLEKMTNDLKDINYKLPTISKKMLESLKTEIIYKESKGGVSISQIKNHYRKFIDEQSVFNSQIIEMLVKYVLIPTMKEFNLYEEIICFLSHINNFFYYEEKTNKGIIVYKYYNSDNIYNSIKTLIEEYVGEPIPLEKGKKNIYNDTFIEVLIAIFNRLEDGSHERYGENCIIPDDSNRIEEITDYIKNLIDSIIIGTCGLTMGTCGLTNGEIDNLYMRIANLIAEDYRFFNSEFGFNWETCCRHKGFNALRYYRIYKILCAYENNDFLPILGERFIETCWKSTSIYISPNADVVSPVYVGNNCLISSSCKIEENVMIGSGSKLISSRIHQQDKRNDNNLIILNRNVIVMQNVLIYDRVHISDKIVIGPGNVICKSVHGDEETEKQRHKYITDFRRREIQCVEI